jgi:PhzF family phenazine biosynthesis protein
MKQKIYQVDAFANRLFEGNPAMVCPLEEWFRDELMQQIAAENNLSETAFFVKKDSKYHLRWFTPKSEVDMCGHATLATAYVLFECMNYNDETIIFETKSGDLMVQKEGESFVMDFPVQTIVPCNIAEQIEEAFGLKPIATFASMDYIVVFEDEKNILNAKPNLALLKELDLRGVCITSRSEKYDFVTRFFAPKYGIDEDPVTGSAFTQLVSYWSKKLEKKILYAKQLSSRGGEVHCELVDNRVKLSGKCIKYLEGEIEI